MNTAEVEVLLSLGSGPLMISQLVESLGMSMSWVSECVTHLEGMRFIEKQRGGHAKWVKIAQSELGESLRLLIAESSYLNLSKALTGPGLAMLPLLQSPGSTQAQIHRRTSLSRPTIGARIKLWMGMGVLLMEHHPHRYLLNPSRSYLVQFIEDYSRERNSRFLRVEEPSGVIVWQHRDEFLFSMDGSTSEPEFLNAGATRLGELGYNVVHTREYYLQSEGLEAVSEEEALVQTLRADPENPRAMRFIRDAMQKHRVYSASLLEYANKYGLNASIAKAGVRHGE